MMQDQTLYKKLQNYEFPAGFLTRLCRENSWSPHHGRTVLDEYRRFIYLAMVSPEPVTPSVAVDQAWHLHLIYTRSYWEDLCARILPRPLHHGPTAGGQAEDEKFEDWYKRTLAFYESELNQAPPTAIWPASEVRFNRNQRYRFLDTSRYWMIPKPGAALLLPSVIPFLLLSSGLTVPLVAFGLIAAILLVMISRLSGRSRKNSGGDGSAGCSGGDVRCGLRRVWW